MCSEPIGLMSTIPDKIPKSIPRTEIGDRNQTTEYTLYHTLFTD